MLPGSARRLTGLFWVALSGLAVAAPVDQRVASAWEAHLDGRDAEAVVALQAVIEATRSARAPHRVRARRSATQDLIQIVSLGALCPDPVETLTRLPAREAQDALMDLAAAALDGGQPGLAARAARASVDAAPESLFAPLGLELLALTHADRGRWDLALDALLERQARYGVESAWAAQSPEHSRAASLDREDLEVELRSVAVGAHMEGLRRSALEGQRAIAEGRVVAPEGVLLLDFGRVDFGDVDRVIRGDARTFFACVQRARVQRPDLSGGLTLRFTLSSAGEVSELRVIEDTLGHEEASRCVLDAVSALNFDAHPVTTLIVTYPLRFPAPEGP